MGWLDHSTNNIILDAVLTDYGRQKLAAANSAFNIASFAMGDDEVDYRLIKKYGRTVGKEKIEKNTPVFEALTNENVALKYKLIGRETSGDTVGVFLPILRLKNASNPILTATSTTSTIEIELLYNGVSPNSTSPFIQSAYEVKVSDRFFELTSATGGSLSQKSTAQATLNPSDPNRTVTYMITDVKSATIRFDVTSKTIDPTTLSIYGKKTGTKRQIDSFITVNGNNGCSIDIPISYSATV